MGIHGVRNLFENNEPERPPEELDDSVLAVLPAPGEGYRYELNELDSGEVKVIVQKDEEKPERDQFGRKYTR
jgi:hypothetical protein